MATHRVLLFVRLLGCWLFALSLLGCAAPMEIIPLSSYLPSSVRVEADAVSLAIPADLRTRLNAAVTQSCKVADDAGPNPRYVAQVQRDPLTEVQFRLLSAVLAWAHETSPEEHAARPKAREIQPTPRLEVVQAPPIEGETPLTLEDPRVQFGSGLVAGAVISPVPFGPMAADVGITLNVLPNGTYWARVGRACGEIVVGTGQIALGCAGMSGGAGMSSTGGGALVGVPIIAESFAIALHGCATVAHGVNDGFRLLKDGPPDDAPASAPEVKLLEPKPKPEVKPQVAAPPPPATGPPPAAKPAQAPPAAPVETRTTTHYKDASGQTVKTVTKTASGTTTTTWQKGAPLADQPVRNAHLAGKVHPKTKVPFDKDGYPDFRAAGVVTKEVKIKFSGDRGRDFRAANANAGFAKAPDGYTWHHHQDGTTMQLVPKTIHEQTGHTGGFAGSRRMQ